MSAEVPTQEQWLPVWMQASRQTKTALTTLRDFTCIQDTQRVTRWPKKRTISDSVQMEVGIINGREAYGWPGQDLKAETPAELAAFGVFMTGGHYGYLHSLVAERNALITRVEYLPATEDWLFHANVPSLSSGLRVGFGGLTTDYKAKVKVNSRRCVTQLEIFIADAPVASRIRNARLRFDYACRWDEFDGLPERVLAFLDMWNESQVTTESRWRNCAKFSATSKLVLDSEPAPSANAIPSSWITVSTTKFSTELRHPAELSALKMGMPLRLVLREPVELSDGRRLSAGAAIVARVVGSEAVKDTQKLILAIRLESYIDDGHRVAFHAKCLHVKGQQIRNPYQRESGVARFVLNPSVEIPAQDVVFVGNSADALVLADINEGRLQPGLVFEWETLPPADIHQ